MSRRKLSETATKVTLNLFAADYLAMKDLYPSVGPAVAIRALVRSHVQAMAKKKASVGSNLVSELDLEVET